MGIIELLILALALAMDAFAVSICLGLKMEKVTFGRALVVGLYFGFFQGLMPVAGYFLGSAFADQIQNIDHWIALVLLVFLGVKMIVSSLKKGKEELRETSLKPAKMIPFAIATSIDALAVGVTLAFLNVEIVCASLLIGGITLVLCTLGAKIGSLFGKKFRTSAELIGGIILILMGLKIFFGF